MKVAIFLFFSTWCSFCSATTVCQVQKMVLTSSGMSDYSEPWVDAISWDEKTDKASVHKLDNKIVGEVVLDREVKKGFHYSKNLVFPAANDPNLAFEVVVSMLDFGDEKKYSLYAIQTISVDGKKFLNVVIEQHRFLKCTDL